MKMKKLPIGISDFKDVITGDYYYVDKTLLIKEILDKGDKILLIPRPRRFGKTLNLSMLKYFYDCCPVTWNPGSNTQPGSPAKGTQPPDAYKHLFESLAICNAGKEYLDKMGKHPVIFLTFKNVKELDWEACISNIKQLIQDEYLKHDYLLDSPVLKPTEREYCKRIIDLKGSSGDYAKKKKKLLIFLSRFYDKRAIILIDEYDAPVHAGFTYGYYEEIINFMRNFLGGGLKDTEQYLEKSVLTGIMRIAKESIFSGLNNPGVYTLLSEEFSNQFGFTDAEVKTMLEDFQVSDMVEQVQLWYNGYRFGEQVIYNPWSIINFLGSEGKKLQPYWINTSDNRIVETLLTSGGKELKEELEQLIRGESIEKAIDENIILKEVNLREDLLWSFLLMGGYLKQTSERWNPTSGKFFYTLLIPNEEVKITYTGIIDRYFTNTIENKKLKAMLTALIKGDIKLFEKMLKMIVLAVFSYYDFGGEPEKVYHALVAGLLIWISDTHEIKSNRESGYGRYDIMIIPRAPRAGGTVEGQTGYVIELKSVDTDDNETVETALEAALAQIEEKRYETELVERGIKHIKKLAIAFSGKEVFVRELNVPPPA